MTTLDRVYRALWTGFRATTGKAFDEKGYVTRLEDNLLPGINVHLVAADYRRGRGNELKSKIRAVHSSGALAANTFGRWKTEPTSLRMLGRTGFDPPALEWKPKGWFNSRPPNLDAVLESPRDLIAIESKLTEPLCKKRPNFSARYLRTHFPRCEDVWWDLLVEVTAWQRQFFDVAQIIKHYLGLIGHAETGQQIHLVYLYWEPLNGADFIEYRLHAEQVRYVQKRVAGSAVHFVGMTYHELWNHWMMVPALRAHTERLRQRYELRI
jgi:hypothetical protein